jgi:6-phosphogluconolactonase
MIEVAQHTYPDRETMMRSLSELVADQLRAALASKHRATLAVPGGTTPAPFLELLSEEDLHWEAVTVLLTDERLVEPASKRSNTRLLHEFLIRNRAADATLVDYFGDRDEALAAVADVLPIDVAILGMGTDMHTASLFPGAPSLEDALAPGAAPLVEVAPEGEPERRLTLSARVLAGSEVIHILIAGAEKAAALRRALQEGPVAEAPIRAVLTAPCPVSVHYAD